MCLAIPSRVIEIMEELNTAVVETMGATREACLDLMPEPVEVGDYILLHVGYAIRKLDEKYALESIEFYRELIEQDEKQ